MVRSLLSWCVLPALLIPGDAVRDTATQAGVSVDAEAEIEAAVRAELEAEGPEAPGTRCCCRGPAGELCSLLSGAEMTSNKIQSGGHCPNSIGYRRFSRDDNGGNTTMPPQCDTVTSDPGLTVTVKAFWMRHGWSCANALTDKRSSMGGSLAGWTYMDPPLTNLGARRASEYGAKVRAKMCETLGEPGCKPPVFSSSMVRAIETALGNFPESLIRPIPYIAEQGKSLDNQPLAQSEQDAELQRQDPTDFKRVHYDEISRKDHPLRRSEKTNYKRFTEYFPTLLAALLKKWGTFPQAKSEVVPVAIVSHSHFMQSHLGCGAVLGRKPRNNEVWVVDYTVNLGKWDATLVESSCTQLLEEDVFAEAPQEICPEDVSRCESTGKLEKWINATCKTGIPSEN